MSDEIEDRGDELPQSLEVVESPESEEAQEETKAPEEVKTHAQEPQRSQHVPRARFDEVNDRLREERAARIAIEERLRALEAPKQPVFDHAKAEKDYLEAIADGDKEKARELWKQIRADERRMQEEIITSRMTKEMERQIQQTTLETVAETLTEKYPFLDPNHETANEQAIGEVVEWRDYYHFAKKMPMHQALKEAVKRIAPGYAKPSGGGITAGSERSNAQKLANAKAAAALPPSTAQTGVGERASRAVKFDALKMSDSDFDALSADERSRLRGDVL